MIPLYLDRSRWLERTFILLVFIGLNGSFEYLLEIVD